MNDKSIQEYDETFNVNEWESGRQVDKNDKNGTNGGVIHTIVPFKT
ncbi:hypothetical protein [Bacillus sp. B-jedd]|nr:hypothetical protein [Bacillus sp. B-jedd]CEG27485.1 hypothetical protein BN1002_02349 [Bacillus sp. B-jedd]